MSAATVGAGAMLSSHYLRDRLPDWSIRNPNASFDSDLALREARAILERHEPGGWDGWDAAFTDGHIGYQTPDHKRALADAISAWIETENPR